MKKRLRIGIDGGCWLNQRGYGRYARSLLSALAQQNDDDLYVLFVDPQTAQVPDLPSRFESIVVPTSQPPAKAAGASSQRSLMDLWRMAWAVSRTPLDVFFFPSVYTFFPLLRPVRTVVAIHDVIAEHHTRIVFERRRAAILWRMKLALAIRQAHLVLTVSEHAQAGIIAHFGLAQEQVRVVLEAPDSIFQRLAAPRAPADMLPALPREGRYLLYVGGLSPHKNLPVLIEAYRRLIRSHAYDDLLLLLVGDYTGDVFHLSSESLHALVSRHGLEHRVFFTGFVPDEELVDLYNRAELLVLPSLEEGFGLPAVEAAACGTPVVASQVGPMAGLLGAGAWAFPPHDVEALTTGLHTLLQDPDRRRTMGEEGHRRVSAFSWQRAAAEVHSLFRELAES